MTGRGPGLRTDERLRVKALERRIANCGGFRRPVGRAPRGDRARRAMTDIWLRLDNGERPYDSLGRVLPLTFLPRSTAAGQSPFAVST